MPVRGKNLGGDDRGLVRGLPCPSLPLLPGVAVGVHKRLAFADSPEDSIGWFCSTAADDQRPVAVMAAVAEGAVEPLGVSNGQPHF